MNQRNPLWTEDKGVIREAVENIEGGDRIQVDDTERVNETATKRGMFFVSNCLYCPKQWKMLLTWAEICNLWLGRPVPNCLRTRKGYEVTTACSCGRPPKLNLDYVVDVKRYVDIGVHQGALKPSIYQAPLVWG